MEESKHKKSLEIYTQDCIAKVEKIEQIIDEYRHNQIDDDDVICEILKYIK